MHKVIETVVSIMSIQLPSAIYSPFGAFNEYAVSYDNRTDGVWQFTAPS